MHRCVLGWSHVHKDKSYQIIQPFPNLDPSKCLQPACPVPLHQACGAASGQPISVSFVPAAAADAAGHGYVSSGAFCMRLSHEKARVTTKTRGVISPLGEIIAHDVSFDPIVNWAHFGDCFCGLGHEMDVFQSW